MLPPPNTYQYIDADVLPSFGGILVDVRTPEAFAEAHLAGALNFPVYQVDFLETFPEAYPDKSTAVLVYADGDPFKADLAAIGRLQYLGYTNISVLEGGLRRWLAESRSVEGTGASATSPLTGELALDAERTKVRWVGRNLMNQHNGEVAASAGYIKVDASGVPIAGKVTVDMQGMVCHDLEDSSLAAGLIGHLSNTDFFDVANHPEASFELRSASPIESATYGLPNYRVQGVLSARGLSVEIEVEAMIEPIEEGYVFQTVFDFDRTQLGALYGSGSIFERLGMHLVNDLVSMDVAAIFTVSK